MIKNFSFHENILFLLLFCVPVDENAAKKSFSLKFISHSNTNLKLLRESKILF